ncbi:MAG: hypothetical protein JO316_26890 [Abitibacteriaceae bacterium]|nr:hypothetical protein [Abditibacteriaceae bacterium]
MAVWSEVKLPELSPTMRLDAEYYQPHYVKAVAKLRAVEAVKIASFADVTDGIHASPEWVEDGGVRYLSAKSVKDNYFVIEDAGHISAAQDAANPRTRARLNDVLLTTVGTIGNAAVVYDEIMPANMDRHLGIIRVRPDRTDVDPYYISLFFNTFFGRSQTLREATGNVQLNLFIESIKNLLVPLSDDLNRCGQMVRKSYAKRAESKTIYASAETLLLDALGLNDLDTAHAIAYERNFQEVARAGRYDAEYFHSRYVGVIDAVKECKHAPLRRHATIHSGYAWKSEYFLESGEPGEPFVRIRDCKPGTIDNLELSRLDTEYALNENATKAESGDLVVGMDGVDYFNAALLRESCFVNQRVCRVAMHLDSPFSSEYAMLVINSRVGQSQLLREMTIAQTVGHITNENVRDLLIPLLSDDLRNELSQKVKASITAKDDAQSLLETAKRRVEELIEQGA